MGRGTAAVLGVYFSAGMVQILDFRRLKKLPTGEATFWERELSVEAARFFSD
jgi:hypothetical protein